MTGTLARVNASRAWYHAAVADPLVREARTLYGLPREQFTSARNERAKKLKPDDSELAAAIAKLPKPTVAAAALNELAREDPSEVRALVQSGRRLRAAQEAAVAGKSGQSLNEAIEEHRGALDRVQRDLRRRKLSGTTLERATQTLRVASVDPELQPLLERGTLHEDLTSSGFGLDPSLVPARPKQRPATPAAPPKPDRKALERKRREARERLRAAERELRVAETRAATALDELERAKGAVEEARRAAGETTL